MGPIFRVKILIMETGRTIKCMAKGRKHIQMDNSMMDTGKMEKEMDMVNYTIILQGNILATSRMI